MHMPRPKLPEGQARTFTLPAVRIRPAAGARFKAKCERLGINLSEGIRQALADWIRS